MANEDVLTQMQVGTLAALVAVCDALVAAKAVTATALIERLRAIASEAASPQLGPYGRNTIDRLVGAIEGIAAAHAERGEPGLPK
jgi:hypothetical protein